VHVSDKATDTINELRRVLDREPVVACMAGETVTTAELVQHCDYSYGAAAHRLRSLLNTSSPLAKTVLFAEPPHVINVSVSRVL